MALSNISSENFFPFDTICVIYMTSLIYIHVITMTGYMHFYMQLTGVKLRALS